MKPEHRKIITKWIKKYPSVMKAIFNEYVYEGGLYDLKKYCLDDRPKMTTDEGIKLYYGDQYYLLNNWGNKGRIIKEILDTGAVYKSKPFSTSKNVKDWPDILYFKHKKNAIAAKNRLIKYLEEQEKELANNIRKAKLAEKKLLQSKEYKALEQLKNKLQITGRK